VNADHRQKNWIGGWYFNSCYVGCPFGHADASGLSRTSTISRVCGTQQLRANDIDPFSPGRNMTTMDFTSGKRCAEVRPDLNMTKNTIDARPQLTFCPSPHVGL